MFQRTLLESFLAHTTLLYSDLLSKALLHIIILLKICYGLSCLMKAWTDLKGIKKEKIAPNYIKVLENVIIWFMLLFQDN